MSIDHAKRFMEFRTSLKNVEKKTKVQVKRLMQEATNSFVAIGFKCTESVHSGSDKRKSVPAGIMRGIFEVLQMEGKEEGEEEEEEEEEEEKKTLVPWPVDIKSPKAEKKVPHTWFVCYLFDILPDVNEEGWERFQCSHRCINSACVTPDHLCWESASENQSRGNSFCRKPCTHKDCKAFNSCSCQCNHKPHCL
jgi:hypothetical protein